MCGICGIYSVDGQAVEQAVQQMNQALLHRGPDAGAVISEGPITFGHRRLAIVDLSPAGVQPMRDTSGRYLITFNGEIYNFQELRQELQKKGASVRTKTDTEVILEAYKVWGPDCVKRFNGMFAFALWDSKEKTLFCSRDRLGKKPFYYALLPGGNFAFSSELKSLRFAPGIPTDLNDAAVSQYLALGYVLSSQCIVQGVSKLPAAHSLFLQDGKIKWVRQYWNLLEAFENRRNFVSFDAAAEELKSLIDDAVKIRLMGDVPLGAFLSGGLDSSSIVASMCAERSAKNNLTFTTGFEEKDFSELEPARVVAEHLGVSHHEKLVHPMMSQELPKIVYYADEPFADTSIVPMYYLSKFTREKVTVALSGDGADEIFGGYETYIADRLHRLCRWVPTPMLGLAGEAYKRLTKRDFGKVSTDYKLLQFLRGAKLPFAQAHYTWRELFSREECPNLIEADAWKDLKNTDPFSDFSKLASESSDLHYLNQAMYIDIKTWLVDDILVKVDRATMAHSLEARAPFLDYRLVEFAASLPVSYKIKGLIKKRILKQSQIGRLPNSTIFRKKSGFNAPISLWLSGAMKSFTDQLIDFARDSRYFRRSAVIRLVDEHEKRVRDNGFRLLSLISFALWEKQFKTSVKKAA